MKYKSANRIIYSVCHVIFFSLIILILSHKTISASNFYTSQSPFYEHDTKILLVSGVYYNRINYTYDILANELGTLNTYDIVLYHSYVEDLQTTKTLNDSYYHKTITALVDDNNSIIDYNID